MAASRHPRDEKRRALRASGTDLDLEGKLAYSYITLNAQGWDRAGSIQHAGCREIPLSPSVIYTARGRGALHSDRYNIEEIFMANYRVLVASLLLAGSQIAAAQEAAPQAGAAPYGAPAYGPGPAPYGGGPYNRGPYGGGPYGNGPYGGGPYSGGPYGGGPYGGVPTAAARSTTAPSAAAAPCAACRSCRASTCRGPTASIRCARASGDVVRRRG